MSMQLDVSTTSGQMSPTRHDAVAENGSAPRNQGLSAGVNLWATVVTAIGAAVALVLSATAWIQANTPPSIDFTLARTMRVQSHEPFVNSPRVAVFLTPIFTLSHRSENPVWITDVLLELRRPGEPRSRWTRLDWHGFAQVAVGEDGEDVEATLSGDPSPFVVSLESPGGRTMKFSHYLERPQAGKYLKPGRWLLRLTVYHNGLGRPVQHEYCADMPVKIVENANGIFGQRQAGKSKLWPLYGSGPRNEPRGAGLEGQNCYTWASS